VIPPETLVHLARLLGPRRRRGRGPWMTAVFVIALAVRSLYAVDLAPALESLQLRFKGLASEIAYDECNPFPPQFT
jgi:hypothetical protein